MQAHQLKIHQDFWNDLVEGKKTAEIRRNDRDYKVGDILLIKAFPVDAEGYQHETDSEVRIITHITEGGQYGIEKGYCLLSMAKPNQVEVRTL
ncbi:DUF3850 domain-containing protein [Marinomonas posidonica]|uniref:DUF3850 domain-containing protein n=1 Tax=Marinomonas posidonica TaxID=936476 RepID=UPI0037355359